MSGKEIRLTKLFSRGRPVVVALDHGGYNRSFSDLVKCTPVSPLALGGARMKTDLDALE